MQWNTISDGNTDDQADQDIVLKIRDLKVDFVLPNRVVHAVDGVNLEVRGGRITALVGESGCGKTVTALSVAKLLDPRANILCGGIFVEGKDVLDIPLRQLHRYRGVKVGMIFQDPVDSLNPLMTVGYLVSEALMAHEKLSKKEARRQAELLLYKVGLPDVKGIMKKHSFQLSGGMCQRVMIAVAMAMRPPLLIADEPTTALDVTVQAQILDEIYVLSREFGTGVLFITHDLGVVAEIADDVYVMKDGKIVENGNVMEIFRRPRHSYTKALLQAIL
jgi:ABC-type dipeptide/oligopeptide/nickel transport system ATPase component